MSLKRSIVGWLIFVVILILLFLLISFLRGEYPGFFHGATEQQEVTTPSKGFAKPEELSTEEKKMLDDRNVSDALKSGDANDCDAIFDEALRNKCRDNLSYTDIILSGNEKGCDAITDPRLRQECADRILLTSAMDSFDESLCNKIESEALKTKCLNQMQATITRTATSTDDCSVIRDAILKQQCMDSVYLSQSTKTKTEAGCENIASELVKDRCKNDIAKSQAAETAKVLHAAAVANAAPVTAQQAITTCTTDACKDKINYNLAFEEKDLSYCAKISDSNMQQLCVQHQTENIDSYYLKAAVATHNIALCNQVISAPVQGFCRESFQ